MNRLLSILLLLSLSYNDTLLVPEEYPTIQSALNSASVGDNVLVSADTYYENIIWPATNGIKLIGSGEENCIIDGDQQSSVIRFEGEFGGFAGENIDSTTLITGFTVRNGYAQGDYSTNNSNNRGGGMYLLFSSPTFTNVVISDNSAIHGGGMNLLSSSPTFTNVIISDNSATHGGGIYISSSTSPTFTNVIISDNSATYCGWMYLLSSSPTLTNVTISNNSATHGGGILFLSIHAGLGSSPTLTNSILWGNSPEEINFLDFDSASHSITIFYSDIQGGETEIVTNDGTVYWGEGNINDDPLFADLDKGDFTLQAGSLCIDTGTADTNGDGYDDITDYCGDAPDMGAYEYCEDLSNTADTSPLSSHINPAYPNPFNPITSITYGLPENGNVSLNVYNIQGRLIESLLNDLQTAGYHTISWNASSQPSGVYLVRMESGEFTQTQKVLLVK